MVGHFPIGNIAVAITCGLWGLLGATVAAATDVGSMPAPNGGSWVSVAALATAISGVIASVGAIYLPIRKMAYQDRAEARRHDEALRVAVTQAELNRHEATRLSGEVAELKSAVRECEAHRGILDVKLDEIMRTMRRVSAAASPDLDVIPAPPSPPSAPPVARDRSEP